MRFAEPHWLWLLLLWGVWGAAFAVRSRRFRERLLAFASRAPSLRRQLGARSIPWAGLAGVLALVAVARPQWGSRIETRRTEAIDLVLVLDLSRSMRVKDIAPSRLRRARLEAERLIDLLPGQRVALVGCTSVATALSPLTVDTRHVRLQLDRAAPEWMPRGGTRLAEGIGMAQRMLQDTPGNAEQAMVVFTDAEDHGGGAIEAAQRAREAGILVHVVGLGTAEGQPIPDPDGGYVKDRQGRTVLTRMDPATVRGVAEAGGGLAVVATRGRVDLDPIRRALAELQGAELEVRTTKVYTERYAWALLPAFLCLLLPWILRSIRAAWAAAALVFTLTLPSAASAQTGAAERGRQAWAQQDYGQAAAAFRAAREQDDRPEHSLNLGLALARTEDVAGARAAFERAERTGSHPLRAQAAFALGNLLRRQGDLEGAEQAYRRALLRDPNHDDARKNLWVTQQLKKSSSEAPPEDPPPSMEPDSDSENPSESSPDGPSSEGTDGSEEESEPGEGEGTPDSTDEGSGSSPSDGQDTAEPEDASSPSETPSPGEETADRNQAEASGAEPSPDDPQAEEKAPSGGAPKPAEGQEASGPPAPGSAAGPQAAPNAKEMNLRALLEGLRQQEQGLWKQMLLRDSKTPKDPVQKDW